MPSSSPHAATSWHSATQPSTLPTTSALVRYLLISAASTSVAKRNGPAKSRTDSMSDWNFSPRIAATASRFAVSVLTSAHVAALALLLLASLLVPCTLLLLAGAQSGHYFARSSTPTNIFGTPIFSVASIRNTAIMFASSAKRTTTAPKFASQSPKTSTNSSLRISTTKEEDNAATTRRISSSDMAETAFSASHLVNLFIVAPQTNHHHFNINTKCLHLPPKTTLLHHHLLYHRHHLLYQQHQHRGLPSGRNLQQALSSAPSWLVVVTHKIIRAHEDQIISPACTWWIIITMTWPTPLSS